MANFSDSSDFYDISIEYPMDSRDKENVMREFAKGKMAEKQKEWSKDGEVYKEEMKIKAEFPDKADIKYQYNLNFDRFVSDRSNTVSYILNSYEYTGGANGMSTVRGFVFDKNRKKVDIQDILSFEDYKDIELTRLLAETALSSGEMFIKDFVYAGLGLDYLKKDGKTIDKEKCQCDGFFFGSNFQNFAIKNEGITFFFDKYAIAPGVAGITSVTLTWEQLEPFLLP